jgi:hypothetical protein
MKIINLRRRPQTTRASASRTAGRAGKGGGGVIDGGGGMDIEMAGRGKEVTYKKSQ